MNPPTYLPTAQFPTMQSASYDSDTVLAMGPCSKASEIFARHDGGLCWGTYKGNNTAFVNYSPLSVVMGASNAPIHGSGWSTQFNQPGSGTMMAPLRSADAHAAMLAQTPSLSSLSTACMAMPKADMTLAPSTTYRSYGNYGTSPNSGKTACGMVSKASC